MNARKMIQVALICAGATAAVTAAEAMPVSSGLAPAAGAALGMGGAQVDKAAVLVVGRRPLVRVRPVVRVRPLIRRPAIIIR